MRALHSCAAAVTVILCTTLGFYSLFSNFRAYDDEGLLLFVNQLYLGGAAFYTDIPWIYGPGYFATVQIVNDWLGVPLSHSATRFTSLLCWLLLCTSSSVLIYKLTKSPLWAIAGFSLIFLFTHSIVNEPGHPQALIGIMTILIPLSACYISPKNKWLPWFAIGLLVAGIFHIKVNAGAFTLASAGVVLAAVFTDGKWRKALSSMVVILSTLIPFILMYPFLSDANALAFAGLVALSTAAVASVVLTLGAGHSGSFSTSISFTLGFVILSAIALLFANNMGATAFDIWESIRGYSNSQIEFYHYFTDYSAAQLILAGISLTTALYWWRSNNDRARQQIVFFAKCYFVTLATYSVIINNPSNSYTLFAYAGPWCWLVAIEHRKSNIRTSRALLATCAVWSPLLAYPIPGSQIYFGSFPILLAAIVCAADVLASLQDRKRFNAITNRIPIAVCASVLLAVTYQLVQSNAQYQRYKPLGLAGTEFIRIEPRRGHQYRQLTKELNKADVALTTFRLFSIFNWSKAQPAGGIYLSHSLAYSLPQEQSRIKGALLDAKRPIVVTRKTPSWAQPAPDAEILDWIESNFTPYREIGPYTLLKPTH